MGVCVRVRACLVVPGSGTYACARTRLGVPAILLGSSAESRQGVLQAQASHSYTGSTVKHKHDRNMPVLTAAGSRSPHVLSCSVALCCVYRKSPISDPRPLLLRFPAPSHIGGTYPMHPKHQLPRPLKPATAGKEKFWLNTFPWAGQCPFRDQPERRGRLDERPHCAPIQPSMAQWGRVGWPRAS